MSRPTKRILIALGVVFLVAAGWLGFQLLRIEAASQPVTWQLPDGTLTLHYAPLDGVATVCVASSYRPGVDYTWVLTDPGSTNGMLVRISVRAPEQLFAQASVCPPDDVNPDPTPDPKIGLSSSSAAGLVRLYADASSLQRSDIIDKLQFACERIPACCKAYHDAQALDARRSSIVYIDDATRFKREEDPSLDHTSARAIQVARRCLQRTLGVRIRGDFSVASADWGYQVNVQNLARSSTDTAHWEPVSEGFGEVFLTPNLDVIQADIGP